MSLSYQKFKTLHNGDLFVLPNAWDARSAALFEASGFAAVGTSSAAVAGSLGREDGEQLSFEEYLFVITKILAAVTVPVTIDLEMGYGTTNEAIAENVCRLAELGAAGINIEDSIIKNGVRVLKDPGEFATTVRYIKTKLQSRKLDLFMNVRCDTYILNVENALGETLHRLEQYTLAGADGLFVPCLAGEADISSIVNKTTLPLNVMAVPQLPGVDKLSSLGVKRVSMGPFAFEKIYKGIDALSKAVLSGRTMAPLFE